jgi:hypothetical protein
MIPAFNEHIKVIREAIDKDELDQVLIMAQSLNEYPVDFMHYFEYFAQQNKTMNELLDSLTKAMINQDKQEMVKHLNQIELVVAYMKDETDQLSKQIGTFEEKKKLWGFHHQE